MNLFVGCLAAGFLVGQAPAPAQPDFAAQRDRMVREQIASRGVRDPAVLRAMRSTPRHLFLPSELHTEAYGDHPLPIGYRATISQPFIVAWMTELLAPRPSARVLEIGTGSGYQAAVLAQLVRSVYTIEIVPELAEAAGRRLQAMGYRNVSVRCGDGYLGWPEQAPFDGILLTAAPAAIPRALIDQLAPGGKLVAPEGDSPRNQMLVVIEKRPTGEIRRRSVGAVIFVPMVRDRGPTQNGRE